MKEQETLPPIKWQIDPLDAEVRRSESRWLGAGFSSGASLMIMTPILRLTDSTIPFFGSMAYVAWRSGMQFFWMIKGENLEQEGFSEDAKLGGQAFKFVYQGSPLADRLARGDNFYYVRMGKASAPDGVVIDAFDCFLKQAREAMAIHEYKLVAMEMPAEAPAVIRLGLEGYERVAKERLFWGKKWSIADGQKPVVVLNREQFEQFSFSPQAAFIKGCLALGNRRVEEYFALAKSAQSEEQRLRAKDLLSREFIEEIERQVNAQSSASSLIFQRGDDYSPQRQRVHELVLIREKEGELFAETLKNGTSVEIVPLSRLHLKGEIVKKAYELYQILQKTPVEELIRERVLERDKVIEAMEASGVDIELPPGKYESFRRKYTPPSSRKEVILLALGVPLLLPFYLSFRLAKPALTTVAIYLAAQPLDAVARNFSTLNQLTTNPVASGEADYEPISFPLGLLPHRLDWKVQATGAINPYGYYTQKTSSRLENGSWIINNEAKEKLLLPPYFDETIPHILLSKRVGLNLDGNTTFRIPVKDGTNLSALRLTDRQGNIVPAGTWKLTDGTVGVELQRNLLEGGPAWIDVNVYLTASDVPQVKAVGEIPPVDPNKIDPYILEDLRGLEAYTANKVITEFVKNNHLYSLDPPGKSLLRGVSSPEDLVNVISLLSGCSCEICNSESVLLSTIDGDDDPLSMAFGYLHGNFNPAAKGKSFLLGEAYHAYGIDAQGEIFDATPSQPADDQLTQRYFEAREGTRGNSSDPQDSEWAALQQEIAQKSQTPEDFIHNVKLLVIFLTSVAALSLVKPGINLAKAAASWDNLLLLGDKAAEKLFSKEDLELAYNFFSWMSWAKDELPIGTCRIKGIGILGLVRNGVNSESLSDYLAVPEPLEDKAGLSLIDRAKMRILARYLLL